MVDHEAQRVPASRDLCACLGRTITLPVFSPENYVGAFPWLNLNGGICLTPWYAGDKIRGAIINRAYLEGISPERLTPKIMKNCVSVLGDLLVKNSCQAPVDFCLETIEATQEILSLTMPRGEFRLEEWS